MAPRRYARFLLLSVFLCIAFILFSSTTVQAPAEGFIPTASFSTPSFHFSFQKSAHKPPEQKNSTHGDSSWYSDWKWMNPFSSSVTLDEDRIVLPPMVERPPVYTYYDTTVPREAEARKIDQELLLTWRRAWWAQGFLPVVLSEAEAMSHPLYPTLAAKGMPKVLEADFHQWLAWAHMGTGLFASYYCFPMGAYDDLLLSHLRRGQYQHLTRFEGLEAGLFAGEQSQINDAISASLENVKLSAFKSVMDATDAARFKVEQPTSIAHYDPVTITTKYPVLAELLVSDPSKGRKALNELIVAHLHTIWQNTFSSGIAVLQPLPAYTTSLAKPSFDLAQLLSECPNSLLPSSCPPNRPKCSACVGSRIPVSAATAFRNNSHLFTLGVIPHPYTMITLTNRSDDISIAHIRRNCDRDPWITAVTRELMGDQRGGPSRVLSLKDAIASEFGKSRSLWFTTEHFPESFNPPPPPPKSPTNDPRPEPEKVFPFPEDWLEDLDWHFGFRVPRTTVSHGESLPPVPGPERWKAPAGIPAEKKKAYQQPTSEQLAKEVEMLQRARKMVKSGDKDFLRMRGIAEKWSLADTEAWKFVRSFRAREVVERLKFEEEESQYDVGSGGRGKTRWWGSS